MLYHSSGQGRPIQFNSSCIEVFFPYYVESDFYWIFIKRGISESHWKFDFELFFICGFRISV